MRRKGKPTEVQVWILQCMAEKRWKLVATRLRTALYDARGKPRRYTKPHTVGQLLAGGWIAEEPLPERSSIPGERQRQWGITEAGVNLHHQEATR